MGSSYSTSADVSSWKLDIIFPRSVSYRLTSDVDFYTKMIKSNDSSVTFQVTKDRKMTLNGLDAGSDGDFDMFTSGLKQVVAYLKTYYESQGDNDNQSKDPQDFTLPQESWTLEIKKANVTYLASSGSRDFVKTVANPSDATCVVFASKDNGDLILNDNYAGKDNNFDELMTLLKTINAKVVTIWE